MTSVVNLVKKSIASATVVALTASATFAQGIPINSSASQNGIPNQFDSVSGIISLAFKVVISAAGAIFILMFLFGGIQYLTSAGNEEGSTKARKLLVDAVVGLVIVLASFAVGTWLLAQFGLGSDTSVFFR